MSNHRVNFRFIFMLLQLYEVLLNEKDLLWKKQQTYYGDQFSKDFLSILLPAQFHKTHVQRSTMRLAVSAFYFCMGFSFASWASRIPDIKTKLNLSEGELGTILLALPIGQLIMMPVSGRLVTKYGSRTILSFAIFLYAIELTNIGWASHGWQLALALFIFGIVGNMSNISVNTQGVLAEKIYGRPIMTTFHGVWSLAGFSGALVGLLMMNLELSPRQHFFIVAASWYSSLLLLQEDILSPEHLPQRKRKNSFPNRKVYW